MEAEEEGMGMQQEQDPHSLAVVLVFVVHVVLVVLVVESTGRVSRRSSPLRRHQEVLFQLPCPEACHAWPTSLQQCL